ncbi:MAG: universal stress protein [Solirubrobacteraceae bacterium]
MFGNVLVGIDGRSGGRDAIALARQLADPGASMTLVHVYGDAWTLGRGGALLLAIERTDSEQMLDRERRTASVEADLLSSPAAAVGRALHELAEHHGADLLVIGSCRRGRMGRTLMGDDTRASLNGAACAVAIAPRGYQQRATPMRTIGVGYDGSPESELALAAARGLAPRLDATIRTLSVETSGEPSEELTHFSESLDLLIVGSLGNRPLGRASNGTSNHLERHARCPLLVLPRGTAGTANDPSFAEDTRHPARTSS